MSIWTNSLSPDLQQAKGTFETGVLSEANDRSAQLRNLYDGLPTAYDKARTLLEIPALEDTIGGRELSDRYEAVRDATKQVHRMKGLRAIGHVNGARGMKDARADLERVTERLESFVGVMECFVNVGGLRSAHLDAFARLLEDN